MCALLTGTNCNQEDRLESCDFQVWLTQEYPPQTRYCRNFQFVGQSKDLILLFELKIMDDTILFYSQRENKYSLVIKTH